MWNDDVRWTTGQPHLSAIVQARRFSLFSHIMRMPDEADAKKILTASCLENWRRPPGRPRSTWMKTIQQDMKSNNLSLNEAIWHGSELSTLEDWCLRLELCTPRGACQKWGLFTVITYLITEPRDLNITFRDPFSMSLCTESGRGGGNK